MNFNDDTIGSALTITDKLISQSELRQQVIIFSYYILYIMCK